jgi:hypothetical protein
MICCHDHSLDKAVTYVNFFMYASFVIALVVYLPNKYPGWLTWVLFIKEWMNTGSKAILSPLAVLFLFHIIPYTVISIALGFVSVVPGCSLHLSDPDGEKLRESGVTGPEMLRSMIRITMTLVGRYFFILMGTGIALRFLVVSLQLSFEGAHMVEYGMNPYEGMIVDFTCLGLMIFGKIFSSVFCSMKYPKIIPAFLLSIWMTIEYWILFTFVYLVGTKFVVPLAFEGKTESINMNLVLYSCWVVTGMIGTTIAYFMIRSSVYDHVKKVRAISQSA